MDRILEMTWSKRLLAASTISIVGLLAVGILGGRTIYKQNKATEHALELSQVRADSASDAEAAILTMGQAQAQLIVANEKAEIRDRAIDAIRASSILDESIQRLDQELAGNPRVSELAFLLKRIEPTKMELIRSAKVNDDARAKREFDRMEDDMDRIEQISRELVEEENQDLLRAVVNQGKQGRSTLMGLGTLVVFCVICSLMAASELRQRTLELARARSESELFINFVPSILIGTDDRGAINRWNQAAASVFGLSESDVAGKSLENCGIKWLQNLDLEIQSWPSPAGQRRYDDLTFEKESKRRFLAITVNPIRFKNSRKAEFLITGADITTRKSLEEELRQAHKLEAIGQLAAGVAHEINTPVQYVTDNTQFIKESWIVVDELLSLSAQLADPTSTARESLIARFQERAQEVDLDFLKAEVPSAIEHSLEGLGRVARIVRAMKEFSHPGSAEMQPINLNRAIELTVTVARSEWRHFADVQMDFDPALPLVPCNAGEFNQVILNLLINASHAVTDVVKKQGTGKGAIILSTKREGEWVEIRISDTGTGIPQEISGRIFDPFFTTKEVGKGTGQGLAMAHSIIVKKHGGKIWFDSVPGKGTTFFLRLPLEQRARANA
ncbi:MAG TPA: ATP-binding protein [Terriglobales bacterium]|nr:ATP-binding protein [Terriglobales bacterium]